MTLSYSPRSGRVDVLFRLILVVYAVTIWPFVLGIGAVAGVLYLIADLLAQLWHGDSGANQREGMLLGWLRSIFHWPFAQLFYIIGSRTEEFPILPQQPR